MTNAVGDTETVCSIIERRGLAWLVDAVGDAIVVDTNMCGEGDDRQRRRLEYANELASKLAKLLRGEGLVPW